MSLTRLSWSLVATAALAAPVPALAGGFYLQEQSPIDRARERASSVLTEDDDVTDDRLNEPERT